MLCGVVDVNSRGVFRVAVNDIDCVCILPFKVTTGAPLLDRKQNTYLRKKTLDVHLIQRTEEVISFEEAKNSKRATSGPPLVVMPFAFPTSPKTPAFHCYNLSHAETKAEQVLVDVESDTLGWAGG